jgi:hypothetical protein
VVSPAFRDYSSSPTARTSGSTSPLRPSRTRPRTGLDTTTDPAEALTSHPIVLRPATSNSLYGAGEAEGDAVGEGDGEALGDDAGGPVVAGPVEGTGVVVVRAAVRSGRGGGSYGPLSAADNAAATTTATSKHAGASTTTRGRRTDGRTHPSKTYHNNAANTTITGTDSHQG